jgi:polar amino acid transport system permease protein
MRAVELAAALWSWTPHLAGGFARNLLIAGLAMLLGSLLGVALGRARAARLLRMPAALATGVCRNVPSFVLMFYVAFVLPAEIAVTGAVFTVPAWIKATLALTFPVVGFASDQYLGFRRQRRDGLADAAATFVTAWLQYFLIVLMASATASVIGVDEIVGRADRVIATDGRADFLVATYIYVAGWFLLSGLCISGTASALARARRPALPWSGGEAAQGHPAR